jgi:hypothetical protein
LLPLSEYQDISPGKASEFACCLSSECTWGPLVSPVEPYHRDPYAQGLHFGMADDHDGNGSKALFQKMLYCAHLSHSLRNGIELARNVTNCHTIMW